MIFIVIKVGWWDKTEIDSLALHQKAIRVHVKYTAFIFELIHPQR